MEKLILFLVVVLLTISCNTNNNKTEKQDQAILKESSGPPAAQDTVLMIEKDTLIIRPAYAMGSCFYRSKYAGREECCVTSNNQEVFIDPFEKHDWKKMVIAKHKIKSNENPNGMDTTQIPFSGGDFEIPSAYGNSVPFEDKSNYYYLISEKGISSISVDSAEACIIYECKRNSINGQHVYSGHRSYSGKLIGRVSTSHSSSDIGFAIRTGKELDLNEIEFSQLKAIAFEDTLVLDGTQNDYDRIEAVRKELGGKNVKWTFIDKNEREHILTWPGSSELLIYNPAYCFYIDIPNYGQFILTQWEEECKEFNIFSTKNGKMELISSNYMFCGY